MLAAVIAALAIGAPAAAQDGGETIGGTLRTKDEAGEDVFLEGVTFIVSDADGNEIGQATSDADGVWLVELPSSGVYSVLLDEATLPEGVSLRDTAKNPLEGVEVQPGTKRNTLFQSKLLLLRAEQVRHPFRCDEGFVQTIAEAQVCPG